MGNSVCRGTSNRERERKRAHGAQTRGREERFQWNSAGSPAHWMPATDLCDNGEQTENIRMVLWKLEQLKQAYI